MPIGVRVSWTLIETPAAFDRLVAFAGAHFDGIREVDFFTEWIHGYLPVHAFRSRMPALDKALRHFRDLGFRVGVNLLNTIGQFDESPELLPAMDVPPMVGLDGAVALNSACPATDAFRAATAERYRLVAELNPDVIWIDDDCRMNWHKPVLFGCACDSCVEDFNRRAQTRHTRAELKAALAPDAWPRENPARRAWLDRNADVTDRWLQAIEQSVHRVAPSTELGLMHGFVTYQGAGLGRWLKILRGPGNVPVHYRPGGGFYNEAMPTRMVEKALSLPPDLSDCPVQVDSVLNELENFPYSPIDKPPRTTMIETTCQQAAGCTGVLFNILGGESALLGQYAPMLEELRRWLPFWDRMCAAWRDRPLTGLWEAINPYGEARAASGNSWPAYDAGPAVHMDRDVGPLLHRDRYVSWRLTQFGLPVCVDRRQATGVILSGTNVTGFDRETLESILSDGAIVDGQALPYLWQAGLGELTGVKVDKSWGGMGVMERLVDHPFNDNYGGSTRDARTSFFDVPGTCSLTPLADNVQSLAELITYTATESLGLCATAFENALGGRVVTLGYSPWTFFRHASKHRQYLNIARWISHNRLPLWVDTLSGIVPFVRQAQPGGPLAVLLLNPSPQPYSHVRIGLAGSHAKATLIRPPAGRSTRLAVKHGPEESGVVIPGIAGWECPLLIVDQ
jgi:hypothetical protein